MPAADLFFKIARWFVNLDAKKAVLFLLSLIVFFLLVENYNDQQEYNRLDSAYTSNMRRFDSIRATLEKRLEDCHDKRYEDLETSSKYWSEKYDKLEKQLYEDYKTVKRIKHRK